MNFEKMRRVAQGMVDDTSGHLSKFTNRFVNNPASAFEWSAPAFTAAAQQDVGRYLLSLLNTDDGSPPSHTPEEILLEVRNRIVQGARFPEHSSSQQSNLIKAEITAAYAEFLARVGG